MYLDEKIYYAALDLEKIERYRTCRNFKGETVATHLLGCALVCAEAVMSDDTMSDSERLANILYCLTHDIGEVITGDVPMVVKRKLSDIANDELDKLEDDFTSSLMPKTFAKSRDANRDFCKAVDLFAVKSLCMYSSDNTAIVDILKNLKYDEKC